jgi:hypothetical protein
MDPKLASALEGLRDIHLPPPVSLWPLAPGWWALAALLVIAAAALVWKLLQRQRSVRRLALQELAALEANFDAQLDRVGLAVSLTTLLRRVALARRSRTEVASLHGEPWIAFLTLGSRRRGVSPDVVRELIQTAYRGERAMAGEPREWLAFARSWIREIA